MFDEGFQLGNPVEHRGIVVTPLFPRRDPSSHPRPESPERGVGRARPFTSSGRGSVFEDETIQLSVFRSEDGRPPRVRADRTPEPETVRGLPRSPSGECR
jgi:hypothetical protein